MRSNGGRVEEEGEEEGGDEDGCNLVCYTRGPKTTNEEREILVWERLQMVRSKLLRKTAESRRGYRRICCGDAVEVLLSDQPPEEIYMP